MDVSEFILWPGRRVDRGADLRLECYGSDRFRFAGIAVCARGRCVAVRQVIHGEGAVQLAMWECLFC